MVVVGIAHPSFAFNLSALVWFGCFCVCFLFCSQDAPNAMSWPFQRFFFVSPKAPFFKSFLLLFFVVSPSFLVFILLLLFITLFSPLFPLSLNFPDSFPIPFQKILVFAFLMCLLACLLILSLIQNSWSNLPCCRLILLYFLGYSLVF